MCIEYCSRDKNLLSLNVSYQLISQKLLKSSVADLWTVNNQRKVFAKRCFFSAVLFFRWVLNYWYYSLKEQSWIPMFWSFTFCDALRHGPAQFSSWNRDKTEFKQSLGTYVILADVKPWSEKQPHTDFFECLLVRSAFKNAGEHSPSEGGWGITISCWIPCLQICALKVFQPALLWTLPLH